jgi:hypothetical protein
VKARPLYWRILRLRHVHPNSWQRALFFEGSLAIAAVLVLADLASAWLLVVLPAVVAIVVKAHDVLVGWLRAGRPADPVFAATDALADPVDSADAVEPVDAVAGPAPEPAAAQDEPEPNVRVLPGAPKTRAARARPGAAAARAQVSAAHTVSRRRRSHPKPGDVEGRG